MPFTNPLARNAHPTEKALTEQAVPAIPAGPARVLLGAVSLLPSFLVAIAIAFRILDPSKVATVSPAFPLIGIYGLIGSNLAVLFYIALALKSPFLDPLARLGWTIVIVALAPVALPVFWYRHVLHPLKYASREAIEVRHLHRGPARG